MPKGSIPSEPNRNPTQQSVLAYLPPEFLQTLTPEALQILSEVSLDASEQSPFTLGTLEGGTPRAGYNTKTNTIHWNPETNYPSMLTHEALHALDMNLGPTESTYLNAMISGLFGSPISNELGGTPGLTRFNSERGAIEDAYFGNPPMGNMMDRIAYGYGRPMEEYVMMAQAGKFNPSLIREDLKHEYEGIFTHESLYAPVPAPSTSTAAVLPPDENRPLTPQFYQSATTSRKSQDSRPGKALLKVRKTMPIFNRARAE